MSTETERKEDKAMSTISKTRRAHELLDRLGSLTALSKEQEELLRSFLPEMPKQKTLEEITAHVYDAWLASSDYEFNGNEYDPDVTIEDWLLELHKQLKGLIDTPVAVPALPAGMRIADHEEYGRVVTSPKPDRNGVYIILAPQPKVGTGADWKHAHECELTFVDAEPAAPAHPEFLETEADYQNAPWGTIATCSDTPPWHKYDSEWSSVPPYEAQGSKDMARARRRVLRWGWGE